MASCPGRYLDGRSAQPRSVTVTLGADGLAIDAADGARIDLWPWPELTADVAPTAAETRLGCRGRDLASLTVNDAGFAALVGQRAPQLARAPRHGHGGWSAALAYGVLALATLGAIYLGISHGAALVASLVPADMERRWGAGYAEALGAGRGGACTAPAGRQALDALTARLLAAAGEPPVTVRVYKAPIVNAFALPGRQIVVFSGLIAKAESGDEVAGVLSHELGHVAGRHALRRLIEHVGLAGAVGLVFGGASLSSDDMLAALVDLSYSRAMETEADRYAVDLLRAAGIRRDGLVTFFHRLAELGGDAPLALLSTHPASAARAGMVETGGGGPAMPAEAWSALRQICSD